EAARTLGRGPWRAFLGVAVPLARPAIAAGVALALMETLADYGTVYHFGVDTFTTGNYRAWFTMGDRVAAVQFSLVLVSFVLLVIALERIGRGGRRYSETRAGRPLAAINLTGWHAAAAVALCTIPILFGFVVPAVTLIALGISLNADWLDPRTLRLISNTLTLAFVGATATVVVALVIAYARRISRTKVTLILSHVASFGYAVPGSVIAVGLLIPFGMFDRWFHGVMVALFSIPTGLLLTGTIAAVVFAYVVRFLAVALAGVDAGLERIAPSLDGASRTLGSGPMRTFCRIHAPLLTGGILTAFLITFVDIMKELPATLILRPFNFDTLAIRAHRLASDERLEMASVPSMFIVLVGLIPVIILSRQITRSHRARLHGERAVSDAPEAALAPVEAVGDGGSTSAPVGPARTAT
ncbi:MAG: iron ABC transporter permease, partial [Pseudomonadota bacterium]